MDVLNTQVQWLRLIINEHFRGQEPWRVVAVTSTSVLSAVWFYNFLFNKDENIKIRTKKQVFRLAKKIPFIAKQIEEQLGKIKDDFEHETEKRCDGLQTVTQLPQKGFSDEQIINLVDSHLERTDYDWKNGRVSGSVYKFDPELMQLLTQVYGKASYTNPLHPDIFPGINKMEAEVVRMTATLFNGGPETCGTMTTGGTESIMMAMKACRDYARDVRGIERPEVVLPVSAHPAFDKAASYFKVKLNHIPLDEDYRVNLRKMRWAISRNTIMIVASAPNFPYGTMDDVEAISAMGVDYNIPVHVDACLGGFIIVFMKNAGFTLPPFDFRLPGVMTISADTHKYGYAPKGSSVVLYRNKTLRHYQYTVTTDWSGGVYGSPSVNGSRAGGVIAACWATLIHFGMDGYTEATRKVVETTRYIENEIRKMDELFIFGTPVSSVIAFGSNRFHIYLISDAMTKLGWNLNPLQYPPAIHICVTHVHTGPGVKEAFVKDLRGEVARIMLNPDEPIEGRMAMYGMASKVPDRTVVEDLTKLFIDSMLYIPEKKASGDSNGSVKKL